MNPDSFFMNFSVLRLQKSDLEVDSGGTFALLLELIVLSGKDGIENDTDDGSYRKAGETYHTELDEIGRAHV